MPFGPMARMFSEPRKGLHLERAAFISSIGQRGAQAAMAGYIEQTAALTDLPAYDRATFERMRESGGLL